VSMVCSTPKPQVKLHTTQSITVGPNQDPPADPSEGMLLQTSSAATHEHRRLTAVTAHLIGRCGVPCCCCSVTPGRSLLMSMAACTCSVTTDTAKHV
jgi:hypothetical protein